MTFYGTTASAAGIVVPKKYLDRGRRRRLQASTRSAPAPTSSSAHKPGIEVVLEAYPDYWRRVPEREDAGHAQRARGDHARADAEDRRGRHRPTRSTARTPRASEATRRADRVVQARLDLLDRVHRAVGPEIALARQAAAPGGQLRARPPADQRGGLPRLLPAGRRDRAARHGLRAAGRAAALRPGEGQASCSPRPAIRTASMPASSPPIPGFPTVAEAVVNDLNAVGIRVRLRQMERAAFYADWQEKKLRGLFMIGGRQLRQRRQPRRSVHPVEGRLCLRRLSRHRRAVPAAGRRARRRRSARRCSQDPAADDRPRDVRAGHGSARPDGHRPAGRPSTRSPTSG